jgi:hypothetical protein
MTFTAIICGFACHLCAYCGYVHLRAVALHATFVHTVVITTFVPVALHATFVHTVVMTTFVPVGLHATFVSQGILTCAPHTASDLAISSSSSSSGSVMVVAP